jgi:hypothetical protein
MTSLQRRAASMFSLLVLVGVLSGCGTTMGFQMGIRPDEPPPATTDTACTVWVGYEKYAQQLQEAYHSRATQNRGWIYVAGILGLGVMAASGGLALASAATATTLGLLSISGGFAASGFYVINNDDLARSYTAAASSVDQSLTSARKFEFGIDGRRTEASCAIALSTLNDGVSAARRDLEAQRTNNAHLALARAIEQRQMLDKQIVAAQAKVEAADLTQMTVTAEIADVTATPTPLSAIAKADVKLTIKNFKGDGVTISDLQVALDSSKLLPISTITRSDTDPNTYIVVLTVPANTATAGTSYTPELVIKGKNRLKASKKLTYP